MVLHLLTYAIHDAGDSSSTRSPCSLPGFRPTSSSSSAIPSAIFYSWDQSDRYGVHHICPDRNMILRGSAATVNSSYFLTTRIQPRPPLWTLNQCCLYRSSLKVLLAIFSKLRNPWEVGGAYRHLADGSSSDAISLQPLRFLLVSPRVGIRSPKPYLVGPAHCILKRRLCISFSHRPPLLLSRSTGDLIFLVYSLDAYFIFPVPILRILPLSAAEEV